MRPEEFLRILSQAARLKITMRHCYTAGDRRESVADHSWRIALMAMLLTGVDEYKVEIMLTFISEPVGYLLAVTQVQSHSVIHSGIHHVQPGSFICIFIFLDRDHFRIRT